MEYTAPASVGSVVNGTIVSTQDTTRRMPRDFVLIDVPNLKGAGYLRHDELSRFDYQVGQPVEAIVKSLENDEGLILLSVYDLQLERAWEKAEGWVKDTSLVPFQAKEVTKGGIIGSVDAIEAFLPASRSSVKKLYHLHRLIGQEIDVQVVEAERERGNIVVSQVLAEERKQKEVFSELVVGQQYDLRVDGIAKFGAFLELAPGITGLLHASELSWRDGHHKPEDFVAVDDTVHVVCTKASKSRAAFSLRRAQDAWEEAGAEIVQGSTVAGIVVNTRQDLGSFISLAGYRRVVGLLRGQMLAKGTQVSCIVQSYDPQKKKASLKLAE